MWIKKFCSPDQLHNSSEPSSLRLEIDSLKDKQRIGESSLHLELTATNSFKF